MSEASVKHRAEMKAKARRLVDQKEGRVDASDYKVPGAMNAGKMKWPKVKQDVTKPAGGMPENPREYQRGGHVQGAAANHNAGRKARMMGGPTNVPQVPVNRFDMSATPNRMGAMIGAFGAKDGGKQDGNFIKKAIKHPGALHKELGVPEGKKIPEKKLVKAEHSSNPTEAKRARFAEELKGFHRKDGGRAMDPEISGTRPTGGRIAKKEGGSAKGKGKTNIAIIIGQGHDKAPDQPPASMTQGPAHPPMPAMPVPVPAMPPGGTPMGGMPPAGGGGMPPPQMPMRAAGGRLVKPGKYPLGSGSGGGEGRLEKAKAYGN